jgi:small subunit ribosomal protein S2
MVNIPSLQEMLAAGLHFGHQLAKKHPKMDDFIYTAKQKVAVIDLEKTAQGLEKSADFLKRVAAANGVILFVGSKRQAKKAIAEEAMRCGMPYVNTRWLGGTFTNFASIGKLIKKFKKLKEDQGKGELAKYTKKEQLDFQNEIIRLEDLVGGLEVMDRLPQAIVIIDIKKEKTTVAEATAVKIPIVAVTDSNTNPEKVTYAIPANDDATTGINLVLKVLADAILEGKAKISQ